MRRLINENAVAGDILSDVLQADACVLLDRRGVLTEQIQLKGIRPEDAAKWMRECADELEAHHGT